MHPKAAYLMMRGYVLMRFRDLDFRVEENKRDGECTLSVDVGGHSWEPGRTRVIGLNTIVDWSELPDDVWGTLTWDLIYEFLEK